MNKYKVGDKVRVICNIHSHEFNIGEVVILEVKIDAVTDGWVCQGGNDWWSLSEEEFELVNVERL